MNGSKRQTEPLRLHSIGIKVIAVLIALSCIFGAIAPTFAADSNSSKGNSGLPCIPNTVAKVVGVKQDEDSSTNSGQIPPGGAGDAFVEGTKANEIAKEIYKILTEELGFSGAVASSFLCNIADESGFQPNSAEYSSDKYPWDNAHAMQQDGSGPNDGLFNCATTLNGGTYYPQGAGLFQETPWTVYTTSEWFKDDGSEWGTWNVRSQINFILHYGNRLDSPNSTDTSLTQNYAGHVSPYATIWDWYMGDDPVESYWAFMAVYLRPDYASGASRVDEAKIRAFNAYFNTDNRPADEVKLKAWMNSSAGAGGINIDSSDDDDDRIYMYIYDDNCNLRRICGCLGENETTPAAGYLALAMQYAGDKSIGYSQPYRQLNPNTDCSSFVWYVLTNAGVPGFGAQDILGYPFSCSMMDDALLPLGFEKHPFNASELQPGDILWKSSHTEIYLGKYDVSNLDANGNPSPDDANGVQLSIGAHSTKDSRDPDGWAYIAEHGDQGQEKDGQWYDANYTHEVSAVQMSDSWTHYYRPPKAFLEGSNATAASAVSAAQASSSTDESSSSTTDSADATETTDSADTSTVMASPASSISATSPKKWRDASRYFGEGYVFCEDEEDFDGFAYADELWAGQWQQPWGSMPYWGGTFASHACGATSMTMITNILLGKQYTPNEYVEERARIANSLGYSASMFWGNDGRTDAAKDVYARGFGLKAESFGYGSVTTSLLKKWLSEKKVVLLTGGINSSGQWLERVNGQIVSKGLERHPSGHYCVCYAYRDGYFYIHDPGAGDGKAIPYSESQMALFLSAGHSDATTFWKG